MARASDGTVVPVSPVPSSSSNMGSPDGALPDLDGTGNRASTMEKQINETFIQVAKLPLLKQIVSGFVTCVQTLSQTVALVLQSKQMLHDADLILSQDPMMNMHKVLNCYTIRVSKSTLECPPGSKNS